MSDPALVLALESRIVNAWPSFEIELCDGWLLRFAKGYSKRANSASPVVPGARLDDTTIDHIVAQALARNIRPTFRLTSLEAPDTDARLAARGFPSIEPTFGLIRPLSDLRMDAAVSFSPAVTRRWVNETAASYGGDKADDRLLVEIVSRIRQPAAFASLAVEGRNVAWGLGVAERGYVGLYDIVTAPELRGHGLGRRMVTSLMAWGRGQGAHTAYLQVREDNAPALRLYRSLGFETAYRYTHRVMP